MSVQVEMAQPPSMMDKPGKAPKGKKALKEPGSPAKETSPVPSQPAQSIEGTSRLVPTHTFCTIVKPLAPVVLSSCLSLDVRAETIKGNTHTHSNSVHT